MENFLKIFPKKLGIFGDPCEVIRAIKLNFFVLIFFKLSSKKNLSKNLCLGYFYFFFVSSVNLFSSLTKLIVKIIT